MAGIVSIILLFSIIIPINGVEPVRLNGIIGDAETRLPLHGATIAIIGTNIGTVTDSLGRYEVFIESGFATLEYRFLGYQTEKRSITIVNDTTIQIWLKPDLINTRSIEVTSTRNASTLQSTRIEQLSEQELDRARGQTLGETLSSIVGVDVLQTGASIAKPVIRGLHSDRVITLQAGVSQEGQQWGGEHAPEIDPFSPGKIEIIKGAAGVEYGIGAIGGVINVLPRDIDISRPLSGRAYINGYSNNAQGAMSLNLEGSPSSDGSIGWRAQGSLRRSGDTRTPDYVLDNTGFAEMSFNTTLSYRRGNSNTRLYASTYATELGIYTGAHIGSPNDLQRAIERGRPAVEQPFTYKIKPPKQEIRHHLLSLETSFLFKNLGVFDVHYGLQQNRRQEFDAHGRFGRDIIEPAFDLTLTTQTLDFRLQHNPISDFEGKIGFQFKRQGNVRKSSGFLIPDFRSYSAGAYIIEQRQFGPFRVEAGARFDYQWIRVFSVRSPQIDGRDDSWFNPTGALGLIWDINEEWTINSTLGTAWRPAGVNERFSRGIHHGTAQYEVGDPNLKPEKAINTEIGVEWDSDRIGFHISAYQSMINDFIQIRPDGDIVSTIRGAFPSYNYVQYDARMRGVEATFHARPITIYEIMLKGSYLYGQNIDNDEPLYLMPAPSINWIHTLNLPNIEHLRQNTLQGGMRYVFEQMRYPDLVSTEAYREPAPPDAYALIDISASTTVNIGSNSLDISLDVRNLLNTQYRDYLSRFRYLVDEPGINMVIRMAYTF